MNTTKLFVRLSLVTLCAASVPVFADDTSVTLDRPGVGQHEIKQGDKVPDEYKREALALKDWKKRGLSAPGENEQWVAVNDKYVLVSIPNGTAKQLVAKTAVKTKK